MSEREFRSWQEWYNLEPFGEVRQDMRIALQTAHLLVPNMKKGHTPNVDDYMLKFRKKEPMTDQEIKNVLLSMVGVHYG